MKKLLVWGVVLSTVLYFGTKLYIHNKVSSNVDNVLLMLSPFANVTYTGVSSTMGGTLSIDDLSVQVNGYRDPIRADRLSLVTPGFWHLMNLSDIGMNTVSGEMPDSLGFEIVGLESKVDSDLLRYLHKVGQEQTQTDQEADAAAACTGKFGYSPDDLKSLGYSTLEVDLHVGYRKEAADLVVDVQTAVKDMYDMTLEMTLGGGLSPQAIAMGTYRPKLVDGRLEYIDRSLDQRTTTFCERAGLDAAEVVAAKLDAFMEFGKESGIVFDEQIVEPYKDFLDGKSTFVIMAKPHEPVTMSQIGLYKPSDVPALLNLTASAH